MQKPFGRGRITTFFAAMTLLGGLSALVGCGGGGNGTLLRVAYAPYWPTFRGSSLGQGRATETQVGPIGNINWTFTTHAPIFDSPAVGRDGTVYVGSSDTNVYAIDGITGLQKWAFATGDAVGGSGISIDNAGTVYAGSYDHKMYALDSLTGAEKWAFPTGGVILSAANFGPDGTVYFASWFTTFVGNSTVGEYDGKVFAVDPATGKEKWHFQTGGAVGASPAIAADGTVYIGSYDGFVYALDGQTGAVKWKFKTGAQIYSSCALDPANNRLYVGSFDGGIYCLDMSTGFQKWRYQTGNTVLSSPAVGANSLVYCGSYDGFLYAFDAATGTVRWKIDTTNGGDPSPIIGSDGTIYYEANNTGDMVARSGDTGAVRWTLHLDPLRFASPVFGPNGRLYVGSLSGKLYSIK